MVIEIGMQGLSTGGANPLESAMMLAANLRGR